MRVCRLLLGSLLIATPLLASAARPLVTDDAGVLDRGDCEVEAVWGRDRMAGTSAFDQSLQAGCGVGAGLQVAAAVSRARADGATASGTALLGKASLWDSDSAALSLSAAVDWAREPGAGSRHAGTALTLIHSRSGPAGTTWHLNLGHARDEITPQRSTTWGVALEGPGDRAVAAMAELYGDDRSAPWWNVGLRWTAVPDRVWLDAGFGQQIHGERPQRLSVGVKLAF
jgi:hypothetical protein